MVVSTLRRALVLGSTALSFLTAAAVAQEPGSSSRDAANQNVSAPVAPGPLDAIARDLGLSLFAPAEEATVRVPLKPGEWTLLGRVQPYAALRPRTLRPDLLDASGVTAPARESRTDDLSNGVGVGGGVRWRLSERLGVFGEYLFLPRARSGSAGAPATRRDADPPELEGGVSVRF